MRNSRAKDAAPRGTVPVKTEQKQPSKTTKPTRSNATRKPTKPRTTSPRPQADVLLRATLKKLTRETATNKAQAKVDRLMSKLGLTYEHVDEFPTEVIRAFEEVQATFMREYHR